MRPDRPCGPPILLYDRYRVFSRGKASGAWLWSNTPSSAEVKEIVIHLLPLWVFIVCSRETYTFIPARATCNVRPDLIILFHYVNSSYSLNVLLTVHHDMNFIPVTNLMHKFLYWYNATVLYMFRTVYAHPEEVKLYLYSRWYRHSLWVVVHYTQPMYCTTTTTTHREWRYHMLYTYNLTSWGWA